MAGQKKNAGLAWEDRSDGSSVSMIGGTEVAVSYDPDEGQWRWDWEPYCAKHFASVEEARAAAERTLPIRGDLNPGLLVIVALSIYVLEVIVFGVGLVIMFFGGVPNEMRDQGWSFIAMAVFVPWGVAWIFASGVRDMKPMFDLIAAAEAELDSDD